MFKKMCVIILGAAGILVAQGSGKFGKDVSEKEIGLSQVMLNPATNSGKTIAIRAKVNAVCKKKGCWMELQDGTSALRVTFENYGFFVPKDCEGKTVIAQGIMTEKLISESEARHYLEDAGKSAEEIEKIKGSSKAYTFIATGVKFVDP